MGVFEDFLAAASDRNPEECWVWPHATTANGYGVCRVIALGRTMAVSRAMYSALVGPVPRHMELDHLCRNRRCANPAHLEIVTHAENVKRSYAARRQDMGLTEPKKKSRGSTMKKILIVPVLAAAALAAMAGPASAHTPTITAECSTLSVDLRWYETGSTVTVVVDGATTTATFGPNWSGEFTGTKSWTVTVDNHGGERDRYDIERHGRFTDCTPTTSSTTVPTPSTTVPVETPFDVAVTQTRGWFGHDCTTTTAWVQFVNGGTLADRVAVGTHVVDVPAGGFARVNLDHVGGGTFAMGPVSSLVNNAPVVVELADVEALGDVHPVCLDTAVETRTVTPAPTAPTALAFTGARTNIMSAIAAGLIFVGAMALVVRRKIA